MTAKTLAAAALACLLTVGAQAQDRNASEALERLFEEYFELSLEMDPLQATFIGDPRYNDRLANNISPEYLARVLEIQRRFLERSKAFEKAPLAAGERLSLEVFQHNLQSSIEGAAFPTSNCPSTSSSASQRSCQCSARGRTPSPSPPPRTTTSS